MSGYHREKRCESAEERGTGNDRSGVTGKRGEAQLPGEWKFELWKGS